jgi:hypothetical protein
MKMKKYQVIGGQYYQFNYGESDTLRGAKQIAAKHDEYWDNWQGWHRPSVYAAEDCVLADTQFHGEQMIHKPEALPIARYDMERKCWVDAGEGR